MTGRPRKFVIQKDQVGLYHVWSRCVRQCYLCGKDKATGKDYSHRKQWIHDRLAELVQIFAVEACVYAILSNHYHLLVRNRVDLAGQWSDREVARRRWQLYPERKDESGKACEPTELELDSLMLDADKLAEWRAQLSDISEFMKAMNERIARLANSEDEKSGHFWQERFGARRLLDEMAVLACSLYIDLNEIRARLAKTVEESEHTSAYARVLAQIKRRERAEALGASDGWSDYLPDDPDFFLCPVFEQDCAPLLGPSGAESVVASQATDPRAGNLATTKKTWRHGFLPINVEEYLKLLDWCAQKYLAGESGVVQDPPPPILERLGFEPGPWWKLVENFDNWYRSAAGSVSRLREEAQRLGRRWLHGVGQSPAYG